jgi:myo-inositol 2-dehydrogenase/D-chiro-inositol 1-dehydrogenase
VAAVKPTGPVRVAVAGLGAVAQAVHLPLLARRWDLFEISAVGDLSPSLREAVGEQYGVPSRHRFATVDDLLAKSRADGVLLLTSGSHGAAAKAALGQGTAVFCEKPLAYTVAEADELAAAERALGRRALLLGYMKERDDAVARLAEWLAAVEEIRAVEVRVLHPSGDAQLAFANLRRGEDGPAPPPDAGLLDAALGSGTPGWFRSLYAGIVLSSVVHDTSLLRALFGGMTDVDDVRVWPEGVHPPSVEYTGTLANGARARVSWHYLEDYPEYRETLTVHHSRGSLQVRFGTPYLLNAPTRLVAVEAAPGGVREVSYTSTGEAFEAELVEFHRMATTGAAPVSGVAEGRADIITSQRVMNRLAGQRGIPISGEAGAR